MQSADTSGSSMQDVPKAIKIKFFNSNVPVLEGNKPEIVIMDFPTHIIQFTSLLKDAPEHDIEGKIDNSPIDLTQIPVEITVPIVSKVSPYGGCVNMALIFCVASKRSSNIASTCTSWPPQNQSQGNPLRSLNHPGPSSQ